MTQNVLSDGPRSATKAGFAADLAVPVLCAPMFLVSGVELVVAAGRAGIIGAIPALNARSSGDLEAMLEAIAAARDAHGSTVPYAVQISLRTIGTERFKVDLDILAAHKVPMVITSIGDPAPVVEKVHAYGGICLHDVTEMRFAQKAMDAEVDGLIAVCSGAGGHAGPLSAMSFVPRLRDRFDGLIVLAGGVSDGRGIRAAQCLGADLVSMGTRFIATREALAPDAYKAMLLEADISDIVLTNSITSLNANFIAQSIAAAGLDPRSLPPPKARWTPDLPEGVKAWRDIWSAGHGVGLIDDLPGMEELVRRLAAEMRNTKGAR